MKKLNGKISKQGYKRNSPDNTNDFNIIPSGRISMHNVPHMVYGIDNLGNEKIMVPGEEYQFPGNQVTEIPMNKKQLGGIRNNYDASSNFALEPSYLKNTVKQQKERELPMTAKQKKEIDKQQRLAAIKRDPRNYHVSDYINHGIPEPGLEESMSPLDLIGPAEGKIAMKLINRVASTGEKMLPKITNTINQAYKVNPLANKEVPLNKLYHKTNNPNLSLDEIDLLRLGKSQSKKRHLSMLESERPSGFYTSDEAFYPFMGGKSKFSFDFPANAKIKDLKLEGRITDRISQNELKKLQKEGYDLIRGENMIGQTEYIPLNKSKISNWNFEGTAGESNVIPGAADQSVFNHLKKLKDQRFETVNPHWLKGYPEVLKKQKGGVQKIDTSNWEQSSLDSLNAYNQGQRLILETIGNNPDDLREAKKRIVNLPLNTRKNFPKVDNTQVNSILIGPDIVFMNKKPVGVQKKVEPVVETKPVQNETPVETAVKRKPKNAISYEPETTNLSGRKGQYVHYDAQGNAHVITEQEYKRLEGVGLVKKFEDGGDFNDYKRPGPVEDRSTGMTGMMKSKIATEAHYGNPSALRMISPNPNKYTFTGKEKDWEGNQASPAGSFGTHLMGSFGNQARPSLQEVNGKMQYFENPQYNSKENFNFSRPEDAEYFANYYKEVAPMMRNHQNGGWLDEYEDGGETDPLIGLNNQHWLQGYKEVPKKQKGGGYFNPTLDPAFLQNTVQNFNQQEAKLTPQQKAELEKQRKLEYLKAHPEKYNVGYYQQYKKSEPGIEESVSPLDFLGPAEIKAVGKLASKAVGKLARAGEKVLPKSPNAPIGNINDIMSKKYPIPEWFREEMRFKSLPELNNPDASKVLENFRTRIGTPEGKERLKQLGITNTKVLDNLKIVGNENTLGQYWHNTIGLNPGLPEVKNVTRHEIEHGVQNALEQSRLDKYGKDESNFKYLFRPKAKKEAIQAAMKQTSDIDDILGGLELRKTPEKVDWSQLKETQGKKDPSRLFEYMGDKQRATNYFDSGSGGREKSAFLGEVQQYMMDTGKIPKDSYVKITPEMVKETMADAMFDEEGGGKYLRLFNIMKADPKNYDLISKGLNKMLTIGTPAAIGAATITSQPKKQKGGGVDAFQELTPNKKGGSSGYTKGMKPANGKLFSNIVKQAKSRFKVLNTPTVKAWIDAQYHNAGGDYHYDYNTRQFGGDNNEINTIMKNNNLSTFVKKYQAAGAVSPMIPLTPEQQWRKDHPTYGNNEPNSNFNYNSAYTDANGTRIIPRYKNVNTGFNQGTQQNFNNQKQDTSYMQEGDRYFQLYGDKKMPISNVTYMQAQKRLGLQTGFTPPTQYNRAFGGAPSAEEFFNFGMPAPSFAFYADGGGTDGNFNNINDAPQHAQDTFLNALKTQTQQALAKQEYENMEQMHQAFMQMGGNIPTQSLQWRDRSQDSPIQNMNELINPIVNRFDNDGQPNFGDNAYSESGVPTEWTQRSNADKLLQSQYNAQQNAIAKAKAMGLGQFVYKQMGGNSLPKAQYGPLNYDPNAPMQNSYEVTPEMQWQSIANQIAFQPDDNPIDYNPDAYDTPSNFTPTKQHIGDDSPEEEELRFNGINGEVAANYEMAGMNKLSSFLERKQRKPYEDKLKQRQNADAVFTPVGANMNSRGDYDVNSGMFRPDQMVPIQNRGYAQMGGERDKTYSKPRIINEYDPIDPNYKQKLKNLKDPYTVMAMPDYDGLPGDSIRYFPGQGRGAQLPYMRDLGNLIGMSAAGTDALMNLQNNPNVRTYKDSTYMDANPEYFHKRREPGTQYKSGGPIQQWQSGGEYFLDDNEIQQILDAGGQVEYLD